MSYFLMRFAAAGKRCREIVGKLLCLKCLVFVEAAGGWAEAYSEGSRSLEKRNRIRRRKSTPKRSAWDLGGVEGAGASVGPLGSCTAEVPKS